MEKLSMIKDTHNKAITAVTYNPMKHEILIGFEGIVQSIACSTEKYVLIVRWRRVLILCIYLENFIVLAQENWFKHSCLNWSLII